MNLERLNQNKVDMVLAQFIAHAGVENLVENATFNRGDFFEMAITKEPVKITTEQEKANDVADTKKQTEEVAPVKEISLEPQAEVAAKVDNNVVDDTTANKPEVAQTTPEVKVETVVETPVEKPVEQPKTEMSNADKIAAIKAKLAAMRQAK